MTKDKAFNYLLLACAICFSMQLYFTNLNRRLIIDSYSNASESEESMQALRKMEPNIYIISDLKPRDIVLMTSEMAYTQHEEASKQHCHVHDIMNATPRNITSYKPPYFNIAYKNPCFYTTLEEPVSHVSTLHYESNHTTCKLACLPYFMVIGFPKCGTTDLWYRLTKHKYIFGPKYKEAHWWNSMNKMNQSTNSLSVYMDKFANAIALINGTVKTALKYKSVQQLGPGIKGVRHLYNNTNEMETVVYSDSERRKIIFGDFTPGYIWNEDHWLDQKANKYLNEPLTLTPHRIKHILPKTKFIIMLRNPVDRLWSDFRFHCDINFTSVLEQQMYFHNKSLIAIQWWDSCINVYNQTAKQCAYGNNHPESLRTLSYFICSGLIGPCRRFRDSWLGNPADALRRGIYYVFIREWFRVFPKDKVLVVNFERYSKDPFRYTRKYILPFLDVGGFENIGGEVVSHLKYAKKNSMLPETRILLSRFYERYNKYLFALLKRKDFDWST